MECRRIVHLAGATSLIWLIGVLPSITAWAGTFEAPALVVANPDGTYSYEAAYTAGANEALDFESAEPLHNTVGLEAFGDGFCQIYLQEGVRTLIHGEPIYGSLVDPTSLGIHRTSIGTCSGSPTPTATATGGGHPPTPTPTGTPRATPLPPGAAISEPEELVNGWADPIIIEGYGGTIDTTIVPFRSVACMSNGDCAPEQFCEKRRGACDSIGLCALRPEVCTTELDPVCGCDGNTYINACEAARAGVSVGSLGSCGPPTPTPTPAATPTAGPVPCDAAWPVDAIVTIGKSNSASNNLKVSHLITGNIIDPAALCPEVGVCTAHRIPVCAATAVTIAITGSTNNTNIGKGSISCDAAGCFASMVNVTEKYKSVSFDGKDTDRITLLPR